MLKQFSGIGDIFQNIDKVKNKRLKSILTENQEIAEKSLELTRLKIIDQLDIHNYLHRSFTDIDMAKVERLFNSLEFRNLLNKLGSPEPWRKGQDGSL
ncbi:MAG: hypothetical protein U5N58_04690 [Actinomycetota bacterium]|nr:hypothetical protein [Actinomycetota bacterium]